jgi:hypothetical protein
MTDKAISPLRQRMIEDMTIRKLAPMARKNDGASAKTTVNLIQIQRKKIEVACPITTGIPDP